MFGSKTNLISNTHISIGGNGVSFIALALLVGFNLLITLFFNSPFSIHLDFFVALSFLILYYESEVKHSNPTFYASHTSNDQTNGSADGTFISSGNHSENINKRHLRFALTMLVFSFVAAIPFLSNLGSPGEGSTNFNQVLFIERMVRMVFSVVLMYVFYHSIHLDLGILLSLVLLANLLYQFGFKLILETVLGTNYLAILPGSEQIKEQIDILLKEMMTSPAQTENGANSPFLVNPENSTQGSNTMESWFYTTLNFMGAIVSALNIFFFIAAVRLVLHKALKLRFAISKIYLPNLLVWFFIATVVLLYGWAQLFGMPNLSSPHSSFSVSRFIVELLISFAIGCGILYLIQGTSVGLSYLKHRLSAAGQFGSGTSWVLVVTLLMLGFGFFIAPLFLIIFLDILLSALLLIGVSDQWVDYRKKNY